MELGNEPLMLGAPELELVPGLEDITAPELALAPGLVDIHLLAPVMRGVTRRLADILTFE